MSNPTQRCQDTARSTNTEVTCANYESKGRVSDTSLEREHATYTDYSGAGINKTLGKLIVNLSELRAPLFPVDMFLLSGDAVANESMLTGESVPVSKNSAKDEDIARWRNSKDIQGVSRYQLRRVNRSPCAKSSS